MSAYFWDWAKEQIEPRLDPDLAERINAISLKHVNDFGVDPFGFDPEWQ